MLNCGFLGQSLPPRSAHRMACYRTGMVEEAKRVLIQAVLISFNSKGSTITRMIIHIIVGVDPPQIPSF